MFNIVEGEDLFVEEEHYFIENEHHIISFFELTFNINIANEIIIYRKLIIRSIEYPLFEIIVNNVFLMCLKLV